MTDKKSSFSTWRPHPWHGLLPGKNPPQDVNVYIEMTPFDLIKYEIDKETGYLRVDRPQRTSSHPPSLYGFIPRTYCGPKVQHLSPKSLRGDGDPLDICVISERMITRSEVLLNARVVGGIQMIDDQEADDKIIAVLENDNVWGEATSINDVPKILIERLCHYFTTYKLIPGRPNTVSIEQVYDADHAFQVIKAAMADYDDVFGDHD